MKIKLANYKKMCVMMLLFYIISSVSFSQYTKDRYHVKDSLSKYNVSSYCIYEYKNDGKDSLLREILSFDRNGNLIKEVDVIYNIITENKYDSIQRLVESFTYCPGIQKETVYLFYSSNKLSKEILKDSTGFINQTREYFYKDSVLIKEHVEFYFKSRGTSNRMDINYQYDSTGLYVTQLFPDSSNRIEIIKNEYGGIIYFEMIDSKNNTPQPVWFSYEKNLRIEEYHFFNEKKIITYKMIYDKQGKIFEIQSCGDDYKSYSCFTKHKFFYEYFSE